MTVSAFNKPTIWLVTKINAPFEGLTVISKAQRKATRLIRRKIQRTRRVLRC